MHLFRLLYASRAVRPLPLDELSRLVRDAHLRNQQDGITGLLCLADPFYVQALEGPVSAVNRLLGRIVRDPRHAEVTVLSAGRVPLRLFPHWGMRLTRPADLPGGEWTKLFPAGAAPVPTDADPAELVAFLRRLADHTHARTPAEA